MNDCQYTSLYRLVEKLIAAVYSLAKPDPQFEKRWRIGSVVTAPGAGDAILVLKKQKALYYGLELAADEANVFLVTWTHGETTYTKRYPAPSAGILIVVSDYAALNEATPSDTITVTVEAGATAGKKYQASILYG